jgi:hypothetical protein
LVLATEANAGAGDLRAAEHFGEAARARLGDDSRLATIFGPVLAKRGRLDDALQLLDAAADNARVAGDDLAGARLGAQAAAVAAEIAQATGDRFDDATHRTRAALAELREIGDRREFARAVDALIGMVHNDEPQNALRIVVEGAEDARALGDELLLGRMTFDVCDTALDLGDRDELERWLPVLDTAALGAVERVQADLLKTVAAAAAADADTDAPARFFALARKLDALGLEQPFAARLEGLCALLWQGRHDEFVNARAELATLPQLLRTMAQLHAHAIAGPPWEWGDVELPEGTAAHNELALLHFLRGEQEAANTLLIERYRDRLTDAGHAYQRFTPVFPGALVAALGPPETQPDVHWLIGCIRQPAFPGIWVAHRAIAALLLAERGIDEPSALARDAIRLVGHIPADHSVRTWIVDRVSRFL